MSSQNGSGFNADERARKREEGPIVIGGRTYHPRRLTNKRLREVRSLARTAGIDARAASKETTEYKDAYDEAIDQGREEKEAIELAEEAGSASDAVADVNLESLRRQLALLLVDDDMQPVTEAAMANHLDEDLDSRDVEGLMGHLLGTPDPTPETATTPS